MMSKDLRDLLLALNAHDVRYLVVGGYAVGVHAEPRATKDLDVLIQRSDANSAAVFRALAAYGAPLAGFQPADFNDEQASGFQIGMPPARIDILQRIDGVNFEAAWEERLEGIVDGDITAPIISRHHLIINKLAAGRLRDLADVEALREAAPHSDAPED